MGVKPAAPNTYSTVSHVILLSEMRLPDAMALKRRCNENGIDDFSHEIFLLFGPNVLTFSICGVVANRWNLKVTS